LADKKLNKQITSHCLSQHKKLKNHLKNKKKLDKHHLRLSVKKLRYALESYGQLLSIKPNFIKRLKKTQDILGNWHDRWVWLEKAKHEDALQELAPVWQNELQYYERLAERKLGRLLKHLNVL
jgi:CHAD domain-containing protein